MKKNIMYNIPMESFFAIALLLTTFCTTTRAQENKLPPPPGIDAGNYVFNLGLTAGYRSSTITSADGSIDPAGFDEKRFNEAYNLQKGINLNSFNLYGEKKGTEGFFDEMYLTASGINDPFTSGTFRMRAFNSYDLKVDFRQSKYYLNRNDSLLSGLHKFDYSRTRINASLDVNASDNLAVNVRFNSTGRSGDATYTHLGEGFGPHAEGGTSGMIYWINLPRNDQTSDFTGSLSWKATPTTSLLVGGGLRTYTQELTGSPLNDTSLTYQNFGPGVYQYNPATMGMWGPISVGGIRGGYIPPNTAAKGVLNATNWLPLNGFVYSENRDSKTPYFFLEGVSHPTDDLDITANVSQEATTVSNPSYSMVQSGIGGSLVKQKDGSYLPMDSAYSDSYNTTAMALKNSRLTGTLNVTGRILDGLSITARGEYAKTTEDGSQAMLYHLVLGTGAGKQFADTTWNTTTSYATSKVEGEGFLSYAPIEMLSVKAGARYSATTPTVTLTTPVTVTPDALTNAILSEKTTSMTPYLTFNLRPSKNYRIDGRYSHTTNTATDAGGVAVDMPVRTVPKGIDNYSLGIQASPIQHFNASLRFTARNGSSTLIAAHDTLGSFTSPGSGTDMRRTVNLTERPYDNKMSLISGSLGYSMSKLLSVVVSGEYRKNDYNIPVTWGTIASGATTMNTYALYGDSGTFMITQNTIDRFVDLTLRSQPIAPLHVELGYSLTSSSGGVLADSAMRVLYNKDSISTTLNPKGVYQDRTLFGGPYESYQIHAQASFDVTENVGIIVDYQLVYYKEDKVNWADYFALNNYKASLFRGGFSLKF